MVDILLDETTKQADPDRIAQITAIKLTLKAILVGTPGTVGLDALISHWLDEAVGRCGVTQTKAILQELSDALDELALATSEPAGRA